MDILLLCCIIPNHIAERDTTRDLSGIAVRCGFPVPTHLNVLFRRTFGTTLLTPRP